MAKEPERLEFHPDAWARFERATKIVAKSPPRPKAAKKPRAKSAKRK